MKKTIAFVFAIIFAVASCSKKSPDTALATVPERLEITPASNSILTGETFQYSLKYYNNSGLLSTLPGSVSWSTTNVAIASVNQSGLVTAVGAGQTEIKAMYNSILTTSLLTVVNNNTQLATVMVMPADLLELKLNETATLTAIGKNNLGGTINGLGFLWQSSNVPLVAVSPTGVTTGMAYGTANVTAASSGIQSSPVMVQVIRKGNFSGMGSTGMAKLKIENAVLKLQTTTDFNVSAGPPDLRIYLGNNSSNINGAVEVASLNQRSGAQTWNISAPTSITQYRYAIVWCLQFGGTYGVADLGN